MNTAEITVTVSVDADDPTADLPGLLAEIDGKTGALDVGPYRIDAVVSVAPSLVAAYHAVFDVKDAVEPGSALFVKCYEAGALIRDLIEMTGGTAPVRFDAPR